MLLSFVWFQDVETIFCYLCGMQAVAGLPESSVRWANKMYGCYFLNACAQYILYGSAWLEWITLYKTFFLVSLHSIVLVWFIISAHWNYCWSVCAEVSSRYSLKNINLCYHVLTLHWITHNHFEVKTKQRWETLIYFGSFIRMQQEN